MLIKTAITLKILKSYIVFCILLIRDDLSFRLFRGTRDSAVVRALASHQCGPGSNCCVDAICGLSLLLVLSFAPRVFSPGTRVFPSPKNQHFQIPFHQESGRRRIILWMCYLQIIIYSLFIYLFIYLV